MFIEQPEPTAAALAGRLVGLVLEELDTATGPAITREVRREALRRAAHELQEQATWTRVDDPQPHRT